MPSRDYGNDFLVSTPHLDNLNNRLYAEEQRRDALRQQEMSELDNIFTKEVGKMRSADTQDFIKKYQEFKTLKIKELMDKKIQKDPYALDRLRQESNIKLAEAMQMAQQSAETKEQFKTLAAQRAKDPNSFSDDFLLKYKTASETPISAMKAHPQYGDLMDLNSYAYSGGNTNFAPAFKNAKGIVRDLAKFDPTPDPNDKLKDVVLSYKGTNDPFSFYNNLVEGVYGSKRTRDFPLQYKFSEEEETRLEAEFDKLLKDPNYRKIYGIKEGQDFPSSAYKTELGRAARLKAIEDALESRPIEKVERVLNKTRDVEARQQFAKEQQARSAANSLKRLYVYAGIQANRPLGAADISRGADGLIASHISSAAENGGELLVDASTFEALTGKTKARNSYLTIGQDGVYRYGIKDENGSVNPANLTPIPYELAKTKLIKEYPKISSQDTRIPKDIKTTKMQTNTNFVFPNGKKKF